MKSENLIHIRLDHDEAIKARKDMLSTQLGILKIAQTIKRYRALRIEELNTKANLHRKIKALMTNIKKLEAILPKVKMPEILKEDYEDIKAEVEIKKDEFDDGIENQLQDIQKQLKTLG